MRESIKHRLIGAAVLTAAAVLFLPSFFKDRQQYQVDTRSQIPVRPSITTVDFNEPEQLDGIEPAPAPETMFAQEDSLPAESKPIISSAVMVSSVASSVPESNTQNTTTLPVTNSVLPEGWVIQIASLSTQDGANKLRDQLQAEGHRAYVRRAVPLENRTVYRVFIGPKQNRADALALKTQLDARLNVNSSVLPFKP